ncbi:MAG: hypothetical protein JSS99_11515 [Actinobacteria bacterium]|nr:hypothetical protein [Actinomycetota bacterium]
MSVPFGHIGGVPVEELMFGAPVGVMALGYVVGLLRARSRRLWRAVRRRKAS